MLKEHFVEIRKQEMIEKKPELLLNNPEIRKDV